MTDPTGASDPDPQLRLDDDQLAAYLDRIAVDPASPTLAGLQLAHLLAVPFENLDIPLGRPIVLDPAAIHHKVVVERRGGYCYELNSQFARLLRTLGWEVSFLSARVARGAGVFGEEFDHLTLLVSAGNGTLPHLVDVGFGDAFTIPLPLLDGAIHDDRGRRVRVTAVVGGDGTWDYEEDRGDGWTAGYRFTTCGHELAAFAERNHWQQTSPDSNFTGRTVCTHLTPTGRTTLSDGRLIITHHCAVTERTERPVSPAETPDLLRSEFDITLPSPLPGVWS